MHDKDEFIGMHGEMEDCIVVGAYKRNKDGSVTIHCQIDLIDHKSGEHWGVVDKTIRLKKSKK